VAATGTRGASLVTPRLTGLRGVRVRVATEGLRRRTRVRTQVGEIRRRG